jgi:hypothetical protein
VVLVVEEMLEVQRLQARREQGAHLAKDMLAVMVQTTIQQQVAVERAQWAVME